MEQKEKRVLSELPWPVDLYVCHCKELQDKFSGTSILNKKHWMHNYFMFNCVYAIL